MASFALVGFENAPSVPGALRALCPVGQGVTPAKGPLLPGVTRGVAGHHSNAPNRASAASTYHSTVNM